MKTFLVSLSLIAVLSITCHAQGRYKQGYIVTLTGDTLHGYIHYSSGVSDSKVLKFKKAITSQEKVYDATEISSFSIQNKEEFQRYGGTVTKDAINIDHISPSRDTSFIFDTIFLKIIQKGKFITLSSYSDDIKTHFFIMDNYDSKPQELIYRVYYDRDKVSLFTGRTVNENFYMNQLTALANKYNGNYNGLSADLQLAGYRKYYLKEIVAKINASAIANGR